MQHLRGLIKDMVKLVNPDEGIISVLQTIISLSSTWWSNMKNIQHLIKVVCSMFNGIAEKLLTLPYTVVNHSIFRHCLDMNE